MILNLNRIKKITSSRVYKTIPKDEEIFLPIKLAISLAKELFGEYEVSDYSPKEYIQMKLNAAYNKHLFSWKVIVQ